MWDNFELLGRWSTDGYSCIRTENVEPSTSSLKATPTEPSSPLVQGVTGITASYWSLGGLNAAKGAVSVWEFNDGGLAPAPSPLKLASLAVGAPDNKTLSLFNHDFQSIACRRPHQRRRQKA